MTIQLSESQKQAIQLALDFSISNERFLNIAGDAYTGKTTLVPYMVKELKSFLKIYNSIIGKETEIVVLVNNYRLRLEYLKKGIKCHHIRTILHTTKPVIYIIDDYSHSYITFADSCQSLLSNPEGKFIILTRTPEPIYNFHRLDPITKPVKPVKLDRSDFIDKLQKDLQADTSSTVYVHATGVESILDESLDFIDKASITPDTVLEDSYASLHLFEKYIDTTFNSSPCKAYVLSDVSANVTNTKYYLDEDTLPTNYSEYYRGYSGEFNELGTLNISAIYNPEDIIGLKFKNVYLHTGSKRATPANLQKVLGCALENLYILEN